MSDKPHSQIEDITDAFHRLGDCIQELRQHNARVQDERARKAKQRALLEMEERLRSLNPQPESEDL